MNIEYYIQFIKDSLTGFGLLELELDDAALSKIVETALQEIQRYYDQTALITVNGTSCIDLTEIEEANNIKISSVNKLYRTSAQNGINYGTSVGSGFVDPTWIGFWQTNGAYNLSGYVNTVINYNTLQRIRSTMSTDLVFKEDPIGRKLYVNFTAGDIDTITIEYVPVLTSTDMVKGSYWIDILKRVCLAIAKIAVGTIRTRFTQSSSLWTDNGATVLQEGTTELQALRDRLLANTDFIQPVD